MNQLIFTEEDYLSLRLRLIEATFESCAILMTSVVKIGQSAKLLVRQIQIAPPDAYRKRNTSAAILDPSFLVPFAKAAKAQGNGLVFVHTHPWDPNVPKFSPIDAAGEKLLQDFLDKRGVAGPHAALLFGKNGCVSRQLGTKAAISVTTIGATRTVIFDPRSPSAYDERHDRQVRLLGPDSHDRLSGLSVAVVGLGGTGSVVMQQLAHLGVGKFLLIDHDAVETTDLNRLVGAKPDDVGTMKAVVADREIKRIAPEASVRTIIGSVLDLDTARWLVDVDFIFCCTDTQASRAVINQLSYQYLIPCIDVGISITTGDDSVKRITGRTQLLAPGLACLTCQEILDSNIVRQEFMTPEQRDLDPYFIGEGEPQPAVISLNSTMSSLATTMFLAVVANLPSKARQLNYDAVFGKVRSSSATRDPTCVVCSKYGALARGGEWTLPVRTITSGNSQM